MSEILCKVSDEDAKRLTETIVEVEACNEYYNKAMKQMDCQPIAIKAILDYLMQVLKTHKMLWTELLIKYVGEEDASAMYRILRFDTIKKVIFKIEIEGCSLCKS